MPYLKFSLGFLFLFMCFISYCQDVLEPFENRGCPYESVTLKVKQEFAYAKFIINDGVFSVWDLEYTTEYSNQNITVRAFYEDDTEVIAYYSLIEEADCDIISTDIPEEACVGTVVVFALDEGWISAQVTIENHPDYDPMTPTLLNQGETLSISVPYSDIQITTKATGINGAIRYEYHLIRHNLISANKDVYCEGDIVELTSCTNDENAHWIIEDYEGSYEETGAQVSFGMHPFDLTVIYTDSDGNSETFTVIYSGLNDDEEILSFEVSEDCTEIYLIPDEGYDIYQWFIYGTHWSSTLGIEETVFEADTFVVDLKQHPEEIAVELHVINNTTCQNFFYNETFNVQQANIILESNLNAIDICTDTLRMTLDPSFTDIEWFFLDKFIVGDIQPKIYNSGTSYEIETKLFHFLADLVILAKNAQGDCVMQNIAFDNTSGNIGEEFLKPINRVQCPGTELILEAMNGEDVYFRYALNGQVFTEITDKLNVVLLRDGYQVDAFQGCKTNSVLLSSHGYIQEDKTEFCVGSTVQIYACDDLESIYWNVEGLQTFEDYGSYIEFIMPDIPLTVVGGQAENIWPKQEIQIFPTDRVNQEGLIQGVDPNLEICNSVELFTEPIHDIYEWKVDGSVVSTASVLSIISTQFEDLPNPLEVTLQAGNTTDCDFVDTLFIDLNFDILTQEFLDLDTSIDYCYGETLTLLCPSEYNSCYWYTSSGNFEGSEFTVSIEDIQKVEALDDNGCITQQILNLNIIQAVPIEPCMIAASQDSPNNLIRWNTNPVIVDKYFLYRETTSTGNYILLDSFENAVSNYLDITSQSGIQSYKYKLQIRDHCGNYSDLEETEYHKTIHLTSNQGINGEVNLIWEEYEGLFFDNIIIYRQVDNANPEVLDQIPAGLLSYTDLSPPMGQLSYFIQLGGDFSCNALPFQINSNIVQQSISSSIDNDFVHYDIRVYPNPTSSMIEVIGVSKETKYTIIDIQGNKILEGTLDKPITVDNLVEGTYYMRLLTKETQIVRKFVKI